MNDFEEGCDGLIGTFVLVSPVEKEVFDWLVGGGWVDLSEERLSISVELLGGQHQL